MTKTTPLVAVLAGTTALATPLVAQDQPLSLGEIVFEVRGAEPVGDDAAPFTLSGVKTATPITEVSQSVSVVGRETFEKMPDPYFRERGADILEVVALRDLLLRLTEGVLRLHRVDLADDVE